MDDRKCACDLKVTGLVQGVGFRPFVYRLAHEFGLTGSVRNQTDGVSIHVEGTAPALGAFIAGMRRRCPSAAAIDDIQIVESAPTGAEQFVIVDSADTSELVTRISPDLPVCAECLSDIRQYQREDPRRFDYAFTNCTNCGPRFSIVTGLPYDRFQTTMRSFAMCEDCRREYEDVSDRRFHAQPIACRHCGPQYTLSLGTAHAALIDSLAAALDTGQIVAMKGIGGFHLACDATNRAAVEELRARKRREAKPFAVMFADADAVARHAFVSEVERALLESNARPIVLLQTRAVAQPETRPIAPGVSNDLHTIGAILPYMPMHHLVFDRLKIPAIVLTSGNLSSEPIVTSNAEAAEVLGPVADILLTHNRDIHNRQDDSVAMVVNGRPRLLRRSRGYVPNPVRLPFSVDGIVAVGAEQKNTLCFGSGNEAILSQHIGDLDDAATLDFFEEVLDRFPELFRLPLRLMVRDRHPDYLSTQIAEQSGLPVVAVGHHHAHIASCMAEHGLTGPVIGVALDGTGFGDDGAVWGGEFMISELSDCRRFAHFDYVQLPGGDRAVEEPWRSGLSYVTRAFRPEGPPLSVQSSLSIFRDEVVTSREREAALHALAAGINTPLTSSAGRLFDAVAALCGVCTRSRFDAEAPMRLADCLIEGVEEAYSFEMSDGTPRLIQFDSMIRQIVQDIASGIPVGLISARFHNTICESVVEVAREARDEHGINRVVLSGGVFQNRYVLAGTEERLVAAGFEVYSHEKVPSNDGGLALGQLAIAAARERMQEED